MSVAGESMVGLMQKYKSILRVIHTHIMHTLTHKPERGHA